MPADPAIGPTQAEAAWRALVDAQRDDLDFLRQRWPDRVSPESLAAIERLHRRADPGGDADQVMASVYAAWGGEARVPEHVRRRLEAYAEEQLGGAPSQEDIRRPPRYRPSRRGPGGPTG